MLIDDCNNVMEVWINFLDDYNDETIRLKPSADSWSMGQLYMHLLQDTNFYLEQVYKCLQPSAPTGGDMHPFAQTLFKENGFPNEAIAGDPLSAQQMPQPKSVASLKNQMLQLKIDFDKAFVKASASNNNGKSQHPGLGFFTALQWLKFAEMHFRHHLRQKERIDAFLAATTSKIVY